MAILVIQHHDIGGPGRLGVALRDHGHLLDIRRPDRGEPLPPDLDGVSGVISLGGPQNVDEHLTDPRAAPWLDAEISLLKDAHARSLPLVGVCLGHQLIAHALGGQVERLPAAQMGFHQVSLTSTGQTDPVLAGIAWASEQFCVNGRHVTRLPPGAAALASSRLCPVMAFRVGLRTYAFQHHFEVDRAMIGRYHAESRTDFDAAGLPVGAPIAPAAAQADRQYTAFARLADRLCDNLATCLFRPALRDRARKDLAQGSAAVGAGR